MLTGFYRVVKRDISKAKVEVTASGFDKIAAANEYGTSVVLAKTDVKVTLPKTTDPLATTMYEIVSATFNKSAGTVTITVRGLGDYGGTKTQKFKIKARSIK